MARFEVGVVGLGYVGLTLATALAETGVKVLGVEKRADVVELLRDGKPHFAELGLDQVLVSVLASGNLVVSASFPQNTSCEIYIISVGTPLDEQGNTRLDFLENATQEVAANMHEDALVILRSTVRVGTARNVVTPILQASGKSFSVAMCPERTLEGQAMSELRELPQIIGADDRSVRDRAAMLFGKLTKTTIQVSSLETAEIIKLVDNKYRDIQFAFANEVARACEPYGVSAYEVIQSGKLGYRRTNVPLPGLVGGPCLSKDPHIFAQSLQEHGVNLALSLAGRQVNEGQPAETVAFVSSEMYRRGMPEDAKIAILGMAFKGVPETDDLRGSMALKVIEAVRLARPAATLHLFDPVIGVEMLDNAFPDHSSFGCVESAINGASVAIITNNHPSFGKILPSSLYESMADGAFIYDYWNHFSGLHPSETAEIYYAVGNRGKNSI